MSLILKIIFLFRYYRTTALGSVLIGMLALGSWFEIKIFFIMLSAYPSIWSLLRLYEEYTWNSINIFWYPWRGFIDTFPLLYWCGIYYDCRLLILKEFEELILLVSWDFNLKILLYLIDLVFYLAFLHLFITEICQCLLCMSMRAHSTWMLSLSFLISELCHPHKINW